MKKTQTTKITCSVVTEELRPEKLDNVEDMVIGDILLRESATEKLLLRTYDGIVALDDPNSTWGQMTLPNFSGKILKSVSIKYVKP